METNVQVYKCIARRNIRSQIHGYRLNGVDSALLVTTGIAAPSVRRTCSRDIMCILPDPIRPSPVNDTHAVWKPLLWTQLQSLIKGYVSSQPAIACPPYAVNRSNRGR